MKFFTRFFRKGAASFLAIAIIAVFGMLVLQSQENFNIYEDDPNVDRMPDDWANYFASNPPQQNDAGTDVVITSADGYDNFNLGNDAAEPHQSVNPRNPVQFFNAFNTNGTHYTQDGHDWSINNPSYPSSAGDPWTTYDSLGNLFYETMKNPITGTWVVKSTNNGQTWGPSVSAVAGNDRNTMAADQTNGPYKNYIYTAMTNGSAGNFARSTDNGATFNSTFSATPHNLPGVMIAVGPNGAIQGGAVYLVTYSGSNANGNFNFFRSTDGGATFSTRTSITGQGVVGTEISGRSTINTIRTRPYPMIAVDQSNGPFRGRLYCVAPNNNPTGSGNKPDIYLRYSDDQAGTWSAPIMVNDNANPTTTNQWFVAIDCEKETGTLYLKWYDMRNDPSGQLVDVYATHSTTGGVTFAPNQRLTNQSWVYPSVGPCGGCVANYRGDYDAISANSTTAMAVWFDGRNSTFGSYTAYYPDYALKTSQTVSNLLQNDSSFTRVSVPSVKNYTNKVKFSATVSPTPGAGTLALTFLNKTANTLQDSLTTYPDSLRLRVKATGVTLGAYTVTITAKGPNGTPIHKRTLTVNIGLTGVGVVSTETPDKFSLAQNYPNPFNPETQINFSIPQKSDVKLMVYNISGKVVAAFDMKGKQAGTHFVTLNGTDLSSGVYFYKMEAGSFVETKKMLLIK